MSNCSQGCAEGISPSKCVEYNSELTVYDALFKHDTDINNINLKFTKSVDGKTLGTGQDLIATVQKLVDKEIVNNVTVTKSDNINVDLQCLAGGCNGTTLTQAQLNAILIKEICYLKGVVNNLQTQY